jgi:hypothetical protein
LNGLISQWIVEMSGLVGLVGGFLLGSGVKERASGLVFVLLV